MLILFYVPIIICLKRTPRAREARDAERYICVILQANLTLLDNHQIADIFKCWYIYIFLF